jgi:hypothetical protein
VSAISCPSIRMIRDTLPDIRHSTERSTRGQDPAVAVPRVENATLKVRWRCGNFNVSRSRRALDQLFQGGPTDQFDEVAVEPCLLRLAAVVFPAVAGDGGNEGLLQPRDLP